MLLLPVSSVAPLCIFDSDVTAIHFVLAAGRILTMPDVFMNSAFGGSVNIRKTIYINKAPEHNNIPNRAIAFFVGLIVRMPTS